MIMPLEDFDFDKEYSIDNPLTPVNESGYPMSPSVPNYGGGNNFHWGFEYKICPLSFNLQQKGNDKKLDKLNREVFSKKIYVGNRVCGKSPKDGKFHTGKIVNFTFKNSSGRDLMFVWILDEKTMTRVYLEPDTIEVLKVEDNDKRRHKVKIFADNYLKNLKRCDESVELFADDSIKYSDDNEIYRRCLINELVLGDEYIKYYDDKFSNVFKTPYNILNIIELNSFCDCCGISRDERTYIREMVTLFINTYMALTEPGTRGQFSLHTKDSLAYVSLKTGYTWMNGFYIESWKDVYMLYKSMIRCYNYNRHTHHYKPSVSGLDRIWWNRDTNNRIYKDKMIKFIVYVSVASSEILNSTGEIVYSPNNY